MGALYKGMLATAILSLIGIAIVTYQLIGFGPLAGVSYSGQTLFICGIVGLAVTGLIIWITEYYTGTNFRPVQSIAAASVDRPRHQCDPGSRDIAGIDRAAGTGDHRRHFGQL